MRRGEAEMMGGPNASSLRSANSRLLVSISPLWRRFIQGSSTEQLHGGFTFRRRRRRRRRKRRRSDDDELFPTTISDSCGCGGLTVADVNDTTKVSQHNICSVPHKKPKATNAATNSSILMVLVLLFVTRSAGACSSRSTPRPRPPNHSAMRPNITFQTYACPPAYAAWYCLNGATCFTVKIADSLLYNCECADGYIGQRCEFKDLEGSYLPARERFLMGRNSRAGNVFLGVVLIVAAAAIGSAVYTKNRTKSKRASISALADGLCSVPTITRSIAVSVGPPSPVDLPSSFASATADVRPLSASGWRFLGGGGACTKDRGDGAGNHIRGGNVSSSLAVSYCVSESGGGRHHPQLSAYYYCTNVREGPLGSPTVGNRHPHSQRHLAELQRTQGSCYHPSTPDADRRLSHRFAASMSTPSKKRNFRQAHHSI